MKRHLTLALALAALIPSPLWADQSLNAAVGGALGGGLGALVGSELGGRNGAILGAGLGAAAGAAIATNQYRGPTYAGPRYYDDPPVRWAGPRGLSAGSASGGPNRR